MNALDIALSHLAPLAAAPSKDGGGGSILSLLLPFIIMFAVVYLFIIMPQRRRQRERVSMLGTLRKNMDIVTVGGIHGKITLVRDSEVVVKVDDNTKLTLNRSAISRIKGADDVGDAKTGNGSE